MLLNELLGGLEDLFRTSDGLLGNLTGDPRDPVRDLAGAFCNARSYASYRSAAWQ